MAFPTVQSLTTTTVSTASTSHNVAMPATVNAGDLLFCILLLDGSTNTTTPSGWTQIVYYNPAGGYSAGLYGKSAAGTEGGTTVDFVSASSAKGVAHVYHVTGWSGDLTTAGIAQARADFANTVQPDPPNLTPSWGALDTLWIVASLTSHTSVASVTSYPTNYTNGTFTATSGGLAGSNVQLASARRTANAASENPGAYTLNTAPTGEGSSAYTIAIRPVPNTYSMVGSAALTFAGSVNVNKTIPLAAVAALTFAGSVQLSGAHTEMSGSAACSFGGSVNHISAIYELSGQAALIFGGVVAKIAATYSLVGEADLVFGGSVTRVSVTYGMAGVAQLTFSGSVHVTSAENFNKVTPNTDGFTKVSGNTDIDFVYVTPGTVPLVEVE